jgi:hypothetical protein
VDAWTFTANAGESIVVRMGETATSTLLPWLRLYGPNGVLLDADFNAAAAEVTTRATNSGTFTVVATDGNNGWGGTGNYRLSLAKTGQPLVISPGEEGGAMSGLASYEGTIDTGDVDAWSFTVCAGDTISLNLTELVSGSTLTPWLRLYGRDGALLKTVSGAATAQVTMTAPASGTYTVLVSDLTAGWVGTGTYRLTVNGLSDGLKLCGPTVSGGAGAIVGIGGVPGSEFTLLTTTNIAIPAALWTPLRTNRFDAFGVADLPGVFDPEEPQRFFLLRTP